MTAEESKNKKNNEPKQKDITFLCPNCQKYKLLEDMRVITRFFPLIMVCRDCEKEIY